MDIILNGKYTGDELVTGVQGVVRLFKERYQIPEFREVHLSVTLVDEAGQDVELVDNQDSTVYRTFEVYRESSELKGHDTSNKKHPKLKLVVDNTHQHH